jgi:hypothetical protein
VSLYPLPPVRRLLRTFSTVIIIGHINNFQTIFKSLFWLIVASMQLLEYFIWKNLDNKKVNNILSQIGLLIIILQPVVAGLMITNKKYTMIYYTLLALWILVFLLTSSPFDFRTTRASNGHLSWHWLDTTLFLGITWVSFIVIAIWLDESAIYFLKISSIIYVLALMAISYYYYKNYEGTWGSVYCSFINVFFVVVLIVIFTKHYCTPQNP